MKIRDEGRERGRDGGREPLDEADEIREGEKARVSDTD